MNNIKVILYGKLKKLYDKELYISGSNVAEIINGVFTQIKELKTKSINFKHQIRVHGYFTKESLFQPFGEEVTELHVMPDVCGGKGGGFIKVAIGAVLIATAIFQPQLGAILLTKGVTLSSVVFGIGTSLVLGGILEMISPVPQIDSTSGGQDPEASKYLGGDGNTVKIGTRIPILYGKNKVFGHYLSFNIDAKNVSV